MNLIYTRIWMFDCHTKEVMEIINSQSINYKKKIYVSNNWLFEPEMNFYINTKNMNIEPATRNPIDSNADFIYEFAGAKFNSQNYIVVKEFKDLNIVLYKKLN